MRKLSEFKIPFKGLSDEVHRFEFEIRDTFFEDLDSSDIEQGDVRVILDLDKQPRMMTLNFQLEGSVSLPCDRCLGILSFPVSGEQTLFLRFGQEAEEQADNVIILPENEYQIDISQYIYEYIILALPMKKVHPDNEMGESICDPFFLEKIGHSESKQTDETDPRWEALKKLKDK